MSYLPEDELGRYPMGMDPRSQMMGGGFGGRGLGEQVGDIPMGLDPREPMMGGGYGPGGMEGMGMGMEMMGLDGRVGMDPMDPMGAGGRAGGFDRGMGSRGFGPSNEGPPSYENEMMLPNYSQLLMEPPYYRQFDWPPQGLADLEDPLAPGPGYPRRSNRFPNANERAMMGYGQDGLDAGIMEEVGDEDPRRPGRFRRMMSGMGFSGGRSRPDSGYPGLRDPLYADDDRRGRRRRSITEMFGRGRRSGPDPIYMQPGAEAFIREDSPSYGLRNERRRRRRRFSLY